MEGLEKDSQAPGSTLERLGRTLEGLGGTGQLCSSNAGPRTVVVQCEDSSQRRCWSLPTPLHTRCALDSRLNDCEISPEPAWDLRALSRAPLAPFLRTLSFKLSSLSPPSHLLVFPHLNRRAPSDEPARCGPEPSWRLPTRPRPRHPVHCPEHPATHRQIGFKI